MPRQDDDFTREVEAHIVLETERLVAEGRQPAEARAVALQRFGNVRRPLADVARATGYGSANAFIAAFKRRFGVTRHRWGAGSLGPQAVRVQSATTSRALAAIDA